MHEPRWQVQPLITPARRRDDGQPAQLLVGIVQLEGVSQLGIGIDDGVPVAVGRQGAIELIEHIEYMNRLLEQRGGTS